VEWRRTTGDHAQLYYEPRRTRTTGGRPLHDELQIGTLRQIADDAGAQKFDDFCAWIDRNSL